MFGRHHKKLNLLTGFWNSIFIKLYFETSKQIGFKLAFKINYPALFFSILNYHLPLRPTRARGFTPWSLTKAPRWTSRWNTNYVHHFLQQNVCKLKENETVNFRFLLSACEMAWQWTDIICLKRVDDDFKNTGFIVKSCYLYNKLDCCNDWMTFPSYTSVAQSMHLMNNRKSCFWHCYYNLRYFWNSQICPRRLNLVTSLE